MSQISNNPFLEGSKQVPDEEVAAVAKALAEEVALVRAKSGAIKEKAARARAEKEAARKAELARIEAEVAAARARMIKTVASIPKASQRLTIRPAPPPDSEASVLGSGEVVTSSSGKFFSSDNLWGMLSLTADVAIALVAAAFTFLIFKEM